MRIVLFYHSLISDWNHGNAHFLRGIVGELMARGHDVIVYEPADAWSVLNLRKHSGNAPIAAFHRAYPGQDSVRYDLASLDLDAALEGADLVLVHEWNEPSLVSRIGLHHAKNGGYRLLFHDTHHRAVTDSRSMAAYDLQHYDGVLAFGEVLSEIYRERGWARQAWTWHEAADVRVFHPIAGLKKQGDLIWIGNWGDNERKAELREFLLEPVRALRIKARVHGVRYPEGARKALASAGIEYADWLPNFKAPKVFAQFRVTVHVPRRPYTEALPGIPTIRVFEALACGIPLISAPWQDAEHLFSPGKDFWVARNSKAMQANLKMLLGEPETAAQLAAHGLQTILARHTCAHRVDELFRIVAELNGNAPEDSTA